MVAYAASSLAVLVLVLGDVQHGLAAESRELLVLNDGRRLEGSVLNESFGIKTPYATVKIEKRWVTEINLGNINGGLHRITTINGNRFSGLLEEQSFTVHAAGAKTEIRREKVAQIAFPNSDTKQKESDSRWIQLRNGDRISGRFESGRLAFDTGPGGGPIEVKTAELSSLMFSDAEPSRATVCLTDGRTLEGRFQAEEIQFRLDLGFLIRIHQEAILNVGRSLDVATNSPGAGNAPPNVAAQNIEGLVWIQPGELVMGSPPEEPGRDPDEGPQTHVIIAKGFWIGRCEVSQAEFQEIMGSNPSHAAGEPKRPVEKVTWFEAMEFCAKLTRNEESRGRLPQHHIYRLPTEAEWEYACRAGTSTRFNYGDDKNETQLTDNAWFARNSESMTHPVGTKRANPWGLHDLHGNVWEWCFDRWEGKFPGGSITNAPAPASGNLRVARGGSWLYEAKACRSANRDDYAPGNRCSDLGFRVVLAPIE